MKDPTTFKLIDGRNVTVNADKIAYITSQPSGTKVEIVMDTCALRVQESHDEVISRLMRLDTPYYDDGKYWFGDPIDPPLPSNKPNTV